MTAPTPIEAARAELIEVMARTPRNSDAVGAIGHAVDALESAIRAATLDEVRGKVWPDGKHVDCDKQGDQWDDVVTCKCGLDRFNAAISEDGT